MRLKQQRVSTAGSSRPDWGFSDRIQRVSGGRREGMGDSAEVVLQAGQEVVRLREQDVRNEQNGGCWACC